MTERSEHYLPEYGVKVINNPTPADLRPKGARLLLARPPGLENWDVTAEMLLESGHNGGNILIDCEGVWTW